MSSDFSKNLSKTDDSSKSNPKNLSKKDIVSEIHKNLNTEYNQKDLLEIFQEALKVISQALLEGRNVELRNFGVFEVQVRKERVGRNPNRPKEDVIIPMRPVVKFKTGKELKAKLEKVEIKKFR